MNKISASIVSLALFALAWQLVGSLDAFNFSLSTPGEVVNSIYAHSINLELPRHAMVTSFEAVSGFIFGVFLGSLLGFLMWYSTTVRFLLAPHVFILGTIPIFSFAPLIIVWFGIGISMKIITATLGALLVSLSQAYTGAKSVSEEEIKLLELMGASRRQVLTKLVIPQTLSWVISAMKLNIGFALLGAFIGEFISAREGIGYFMLRAGSLYDVSSVFAGGFYLVIIGAALNEVVKFIERNKNIILSLI